MNAVIYKTYERLCADINITGSVLEVGAVPSKHSLLCMKALEHADERTGINLTGPHYYGDIVIHKGNSNDMDMFESDRFDAVFCSAVLEHDRYFWKTLKEIRRVAKPGGLVMLGVPGYKRYAIEKMHTLLRMIPGVCRLEQSRWFEGLFSATLTYEIHDAPGDYYRFSEQAFREVLLQGLEDVKVISVMTPPRFIGYGRIPHDKQ